MTHSRNNAFTHSCILAVLAMLSVIDPALASDDWVAPATGLLDALESGLVTIGSSVIGLAIIGVGIWAALSADPNWRKVGGIVFAGILIMAGPAALRALLKALA